MISIPYQNATSGQGARNEIVKILTNFGCQTIGFMDDLERKEVLLAFTYRNAPVQLRASAKGWAAMFLRKKPYTSRKHKNRKDYEAAALERGMIAVNSILRDWVKGKITAIESGILKFEYEFFPYMIGEDGKTLVESGVLELPSPKIN